MHVLLFTMNGPLLKDMIGTFLFAFSVIFLVGFVLNKLARIKKDSFHPQQFLIAFIVSILITAGSYLGLIN
ncbi:hypothetical protein [Bacillus testis]|uniref:hypothetical protein n=1 Tax=Bacillus testis TaxID=1622072 RepID=UPI00067F3C34|nr:hypothetical protein [Bacillus testis]